MVTVGLTPSEPLADEGRYAPGVIVRLVAPAVAQLNVLLEPEGMLAGLAVKELIVGLPAVFTVMVAVDVAEPAELVAVSV